MSNTGSLRVAILTPGDRAQRDRASPAESRFAALFEALIAAGVQAELAIYRDDFVEEVRAQLLGVDGVLVWHNPIEAGRSRRVLDAMLREVAACGVFVSTHPDTILALGTKDVLLSVRDLPFGSDVWRVDGVKQIRSDVMRRLACGPRVLKQHRGHSGIGVWRIEFADARGQRFRMQHAQRGAREEIVDLDGVLERLRPYFADGGHMIDQAWQPRLVEGMVRAYLVRGRVAGFGHQALNALHPGIAGADAPVPGPRLYRGPDDLRDADLRHRLEQHWVRLLCERLAIAPDRLPLLWDADFLPGEASGSEARYVLCEINVSSVSPFPPSAIGPLVEAVMEALDSHARRRQRPAPASDV